MRARYYSPEMRRFINADVLHGAISDSTSLNRYSYVNGNPVSFVDPFGLEKERGSVPTPLEAAYMARHIYGASNSDTKKATLGKGFGMWKLKKIYENNQGLKIGVYYKDVNGIISYALVNAGSAFNLFGDFSGTYNDWILNNFTQPFGNSLDMKDSIAYAKEFASKNPNSRITFVGHSKGGAEAVANAVATNNDAIVFNPATAFLNKYDLPTEQYTGNVTSYVVQGEALDYLSGALGKNIGTEVPLYDTQNNYYAPEWDPQLLGAQEPTAQLGQLIGNGVNFVREKIGKHSMELVIELLGGE